MSSTANETTASSSPSSVARRLAASTISGAKSVETSRPPGASERAASRPVSPGPAASSRIVSPGRGSRSSTSRSETTCVDSQKSWRWRSQPAATERQLSTGSLTPAPQAAAPANCGMILRPYASSVASWLCVIR